jgi:hypothetical protein
MFKNLGRILKEEKSYLLYLKLRLNVVELLKKQCILVKNIGNRKELKLKLIIVQEVTSIFQISIMRNI